MNGMLHKNPALTVDLIIVAERRVLLIKRAREPFSGFWALVGGFVEYGETVEEAAVREAKEETGLDVKLEDSRSIL